MQYVRLQISFRLCSGDGCLLLSHVTCKPVVRVEYHYGGRQHQSVKRSERMGAQFCHEIERPTSSLLVAVPTKNSAAGGSGHGPPKRYDRPRLVSVDVTWHLVNCRRVRCSDCTASLTAATRLMRHPSARVSRFHYETLLGVVWRATAIPVSHERA